MNPDMQILNKKPDTKHHAEIFELHPEGSVLCGRHSVLRLKNNIDANTGDCEPYFYMFGGRFRFDNPMPINGVIDLVDKTGLRITPLRIMYRNNKLHHVKLFVELINNKQLEWLSSPSAS